MKEVVVVCGPADAPGCEWLAAAGTGWPDDEQAAPISPAVEQELAACCCWTAAD